MLHALFLRRDVVIHQEILSHQYALLIDDIIEFTLLFLDYVLFVLLLVVVIVVFLVIKIFFRLLLLILQVIELIQYVLYLALELLVTLLHQVLKHLGHAQLLGLLPEPFASED